MKGRKLNVVNFSKRENSPVPPNGIESPYNKATSTIQETINPIGGPIIERKWIKLKMVSSCSSGKPDPIKLLSINFAEIGAVIIAPTVLNDVAVKMSSSGMGYPISLFIFRNLLGFKNKSSQLINLTSFT